MLRVLVAVLVVLGALLPAGAAYAEWIDPALANTGGPPAPPEAGVPINGGSFTGDGVLGFGRARPLGAPSRESMPAVAMARTPDGDGYWVVAADGAVNTIGDAGFYGSLAGVPLEAPIVGMAPTPDGHGYWLVGIDGGILAFGDARFLGSMGAVRLNQPIVGMAATPDGRGYWEVASDGGIFSFGDARYLGSTGALALYAPIVGMARTPDGLGYWLVASDGGIFRFGDAGFYGSLGATDIDTNIVGMAPTPDGRGYWLAGDDGEVMRFGDAGDFGDNSAEDPTPVVTSITAAPGGDGYWLLSADEIPTVFGTGAIADAAASQVHGNPTPGYFCNPYGPCEEWCALFATWAWNQAGIPIPRYAFTGDIFGWAAASGGGVLPPSAHAAPGDAVLYGTGPSSGDTSLHVGIVGQVWPDGAIVTIDGDAGPGPNGGSNVVMNGPFLPADSHRYNGFGIYAFAVP
jgi:hypothetical protein